MSIDAENTVVAAPVAEEEGAPAEGSNRRNEVFIRGLSYSTRELALARYIENVAPVFVLILCLFSLSSSHSMSVFDCLFIYHGYVFCFS